MTPDNIVATLRAVDALLALLANAGISGVRIAAMRERSATGSLTEDDIDELANQAHDAVRRLG